MAFTIEERPGRAGDRTGTVYVITESTGLARMEVWPFTGFNCLRWQVRIVGGLWGDLLYTASDWETNPVPTRSGHPILFPFPNRLRDGRMTFQGKEYTLPLNDPAKQNAIHGFTPRVPWRVIATGDGAITGQFRLSIDAPEALSLWPADCGLTLTYRLRPDALRVEATVENFGPGPMPWGLGYHPYFCLPTSPNAAVDEMVLHATAHSLWVTDGGVPSGEKSSLPGELDFRSARTIGSTVLDNLFGDLKPEPSGEPLVKLATLASATAPGMLEVLADAAFRELVLFTPQHRKAVAIEPYTCATDAANLEPRGISAGWRELSAGNSFTANVEYRWRG